MTPNHAFEWTAASAASLACDSLLASLVRAQREGSADVSLMGSSYTEFQGNGFWCSDPALEVWLYLLVQEIDKCGELPRWLAEAREHWYLCATVGFTGCISAALDDHLTDQPRVEAALGLAQTTLAWLEIQGPFLRREALNAMGTGGRGSYFTRDAETKIFLTVGQAFVQLLRGEWQANGATSPMLGI